MFEKPESLAAKSALRDELKPGMGIGVVKPCGHQAAGDLTEDLAARARQEIDTDELSIYGLQALVLLFSAFTAAGKGKKAIRQDLDVWASRNEDVFSNLGTLFGQSHSTIILLSKANYRLVICLIYRSFLPVILEELEETGQHRSWQNETNVHVHGAHHSQQGNQDEPNLFNSAVDLSSTAMQVLSELRYAWATVQHQHETLQDLHHGHGELVKALARSSMHHTLGAHGQGFFDRYFNIRGPGRPTFSFDGANVRLADVAIDMGSGPTAEDALRNNGGTQRPNLNWML
ncbi:nitrate assimilation regulatory nirA [Fusarium coicis]|nr:nitrate assimilation regulatory nirA [Fusarium coicis]